MPHPAYFAPEAQSLLQRFVDTEDPEERIKTAVDFANLHHDYAIRGVIRMIRSAALVGDAERVVTSVHLIFETWEAFGGSPFDAVAVDAAIRDVGPVLLDMAPPAPTESENAEGILDNMAQVIRAFFGTLPNAETAVADAARLRETLTPYAALYQELTLDHARAQGALVAELIKKQGLSEHVAFQIVCGGMSLDGFKAASDAVAKGVALAHGAKGVLP